MYRLLFIAKNNLKKKKNDVIVLVGLIALAALLLYISISAMTNIDRTFQKAYEKANTADLVFISGSKETEKISELYAEQEEVKDFEVTPCLYLLDAKYHSDREKEERNFIFCLEAIEETRTINKIAMTGEGEQKKDSIILPYYFKAGYKYELGDAFYLTLGSRTYEFEVMGFAEDPMFTTPMNVSIYKCYIPQKVMDEILSADEMLSDSIYQEYKVKLKEGESSSAFDGKMSVILSKEINDIFSNSPTMNWETMREGAAVMSGLVTGMLLIFAVLLVIIALIVIRFSIRNFVEENLKNIGILQSAGYQSWELLAGSVFEMLLISLSGSCAGLLLGFLFGGFIGDIQASIAGLNWEQNIDVVSALVTLAAIVIIILGITFFTGRIYKKITVLDALRGGIHTHNFRKNHLSLERTRVALIPALGTKTILGEKVKSFSILFITALLSFSCSVSFSLYENFALSPEKLLNMTGMEIGTAVAFGEDMYLKGEEIATWENVDNVQYNNNISVELSYAREQISVSCDIWSEPEKLENDMLVEGRFPECDNEIVLSTVVAERMGAAVGDLIYVRGTGEELSYMITGIDQKINNMGMKVLMNFDGGKRLNGTMEPSLFYVMADENYSTLSKRIMEEFPDLKLTDNSKAAESSISAVVLAAKMLCTLFSAITVAAVFLVVFLLVKSRIIRERKNYGINKALGFTTRQLTAQSIMSIVPVIFTGASVGALLSLVATSPMVILGLSFCGIRKCEMTASAAGIILPVAGLTLISFLVAWICSAGIKKIEVVKMLAED